MKKEDILPFILATIVVMIIVYLVSSFIALIWNPFCWPMWLRFIYTVVIILAMLIMSGNSQSKIQ